MLSSSCGSRCSKILRNFSRGFDKYLSSRKKHDLLLAAVVISSFQNIIKYNKLTTDHHFLSSFYLETKVKGVRVGISIFLCRASCLLLLWSTSTVYCCCGCCIPPFFRMSRLGPVDICQAGILDIFCTSALFCCCSAACCCLLFVGCLVQIQCEFQHYS